MSEKFSGTRPMSPQHAVDVDRLAAYLRAHVDWFSAELAVPLAEQARRQVEKIVAGKL